MPLDLDFTDPMYLLGRVVAVIDGPDPTARRVSDTTVLDVLLVKPAKGFGLLVRKFEDRLGDPDVQSVIAILPASLPAGPVPTSNQSLYWMGYYHQRGQDEADRSMTAKFTPEVIRRVGETLWGEDHWQAEMTRALGLNDSSRVRAWISDNDAKRRKVPAGVCRDLMAMLRQQSASAKALADQIDAP